MATDLAEFLGASIGCSLLLGTSLLAGTLMIGAAAWGVLALQRQSLRAVEGLVAVMALLVGVCFAVELLLAPPDWRSATRGALVPSLGGPGGAALAAAIVGATVMPHALFVHSRAAANRLAARNAAGLKRLVRASTVDIAVTLGGAGLVNMAMLCLAVVSLGAAGSHGQAGIETAYRLLGPLFGGLAASIFMVSLLASGLSSSVVGTLAGQVIMQDFVAWRIPLWLRRLITMLPAVVLAAFTADVTRALLMSQIVLSLVLPIPLVTLVLFTGSRSVMGELANGWAMRLAATAATATVLLLNAILVWQAIG